MRLLVYLFILFALVGCAAETAVFPLTQAIHKTTAVRFLPQRQLEPQRPLPLTTFAMPPRPLTALGLIRQAETNARQLNSSQFKQTIIVESRSFWQQIEQHCRLHFPDKMHCQTAVQLVVNDTPVRETETETVQHGEQLWLREGNEPWQIVAKQETGQETAVFQPHPTLLSHFMQQPNLAGSTRLAGQAMQKIAFDLDVVAYIQAMLPAETAVLFSQAARTSHGSGTLWISQAQQLTKQAIINMQFNIAGEPLTITTKATYFGFNDPVAIPAPRPLSSEVAVEG